MKWTKIILLSCLAAVFCIWLRSAHADPVAGYICNTQTKECFFDVIRDDQGEVAFPGCSVREVGDKEMLKGEGYAVISGDALRKRASKSKDYAFCGAAPKPVDVPLPKTASGVTQQIEGFNLVGYSDGGEKSWDIKGDKADILGDEVAVTNVDANSYGDKDMNLTAKKGTLDKATGNVHLEQDVVITSEDGAQMKTDTLEWQRKNDLVQTKDRVVIEDKDMQVSGTGMEARPSVKSAVLKSDVTANIAAAASGVNGEKKNNRIQITSDGPMELDQASQKAIFHDNVIAIELSTGRKLKADMMEVKFDQTAKKIEEIVCTGDVELHQGENVTHSDMLVYKADEQRMTLTGRPKLLIDPGTTDTKEFFKY